MKTRGKFGPWQGRCPEFAHLDFCQYGESWKKGTSFLHYGLDLSPLDKRCHMKQGRCSRTGERHVVLQGTDAAGKFLTLTAQPYPHALCTRFAQLLRQHLAGHRCG